MKLVHPMWNNPIEFEENIIPILVVENHILFRQYVEMLLMQSLKDEGLFVLSEADQILNISKTLDVICDPFHIDINDRKIITKLYTALSENMLNENLYLQTAEIKIQLLQYIQSVLDEVEEELVYEQNIEPSGILKLLNVHFQEEMDFCERIITYLDITRTYLGKKCFVFVNIRSYLSDEEIKMLYRQIQYNKHHVLFIETYCPDEIKDNEKILIIDDDMCII